MVQVLLMRSSNYMEWVSKQDTGSAREKTLDRKTPCLSFV